MSNNSNPDQKRQPEQYVFLIRLLAKAMEDGVLEVWRDQDDVPHATIKIDDRFENLCMSSSRFKGWVRAEGLEKFNRVFQPKHLDDAVAHLISVVIYDAPKFQTHVRVAFHDGCIYHDLCDEKWRAVKITAKGWEVADKVPVKFIRPNATLPLPVPTPGGSLEDLKRFTNFGGDDDKFKLFIGGVLGLFSDGPFPTQMFSCVHDSGKSTTGDVMQKLCDPRRASKMGLPSNPHDFAIAAENARVVYFDNISSMPKWVSDCLCRLATGGGFQTRRLWTNSGQAVFDHMRPVIITSINPLISADGANTDLFSRAIVYKMPGIEDKDRIDDKELEADFDKIRPGVMSVIYDVLSAILKNLPSVKLDRLPRMASFVKWVTAGEKALGWKPETYLDLFDRDQAEAFLDALDAWVIYPVLKTLLIERGGRIQATATKLLEQLQFGMSPLPKGWPRAAHILSGQLAGHSKGLLDAGIRVSWGRTTDASRTRTIIIEQIGGIADASGRSSVASRYGLHARQVALNASDAA